MKILRSLIEEQAKNQEKDSRAEKGAIVLKKEIDAAKVIQLIQVLSCWKEEIFNPAVRASENERSDP